MIVAVHEGAGLFQRALHQPVGGPVPVFLLPRIEAQPQQPLDEPLAEQSHLVAQQGLVIGGKIRGRHPALHEPDRFQRITIEGWRGLLVEHIEIVRITEILHQQETLLPVAGQYLRRRQTGIAQAAVDLEEIVEGLAVRRRIHYHPHLAVAIRQAEIPAEAGILGSRTQILGGQSLLLQPGLQGLQAVGG